MDEGGGSRGGEEQERGKTTKWHGRGLERWKVEEHDDGTWKQGRRGEKARRRGRHAERKQKLGQREEFNSPLKQGPLLAMNVKPKPSQMLPP